MLLPVTEKVNDNNVIVGTLSNSASTSKFTKISAASVGNIFALLPSTTSAGSLPKEPDFPCTNIHTLEEYFPAAYANNDSFKFVKLPTIFPLPYGTTAIKGSLFNDSIGDALRNISKTTGPLWSKLLVTWSKPLADAVLNNLTIAMLLPPLKKDQR